MKKWMSLLLAVMICVAAAPVSLAEVDWENPPGGMYLTPANFPDTDLSSYYKVRMYTVSPEATDEAIVIDAINQELMERGFNTEIELVHMVSANGANMYSLTLASGEVTDVYFTASWAYMWEEAARGSWMQLSEEFLKKYLPSTWKTQDAASWSEVTYGGSIIAIPGNVMNPNVKFALVRQDLIEKYGFDALRSWDDYKRFALTIAKEETPVSGIYALNANYESNVELWRTYVQQGNYVLLSGELFNYQYKGEGVLPNFKEDVKCVYETDRFRQFCHEVKEMADAGCWSQSALTNTVYDHQAFGNLTSASAFWNGSLFSYARQAEENENVRTAAYDLFPEAVAIPEAYSNSNLTIPETSGNPERAAMIIDILRNDFQLINMYKYGVEGMHWRYLEDGTYEVLQRDKYSGDAISWALRQPWLPVEKSDDTRARDMAESQRPRMVPIATVSFIFDDAPVKAYISAVNAVVAEYGNMLRLGLVDDVDATLREFVKKLYDSGLQRVYDEMGQQYEAWMQAR